VSKKHQREFFRLAGVYLACRLCVMGGEVVGHQKGPLDFELLGMKDHAIEMRLLIEEVRKG
jgi:hypothetical protein